MTPARLRADPLIALLPLLLATTACSRDDELVKQADQNLSEPDITLDVWSIDFGAVPLGDTEARTVTVMNRGNAALTVNRVTPEGAGAFTVTEGQLPVDIAAEGEWTFEVTYSPTGIDTGRVEIGSSDPDSPTVSVELDGEAAYPQLDADPNEFDVGRVVRCGEEVDTVDLVNVGEAPLTITELDSVGNGWSVLSAPELPITLQTGEATPVSMHFSPLMDGDAPGTLWVTSNDPRELVDVPLVGRGEGYAVDERAETHIQPSGPYDGVDIVFFVDQSSSMDDDRRKLGESFHLLVEALDDVNIDWQAAVVSADDGCSNSGIIAAGDPSAVSRFTDGLLGDWGWYAESGLTVASQALAAAAPGGCNDGLLRDSALPLVVVVADERDHSEPNWQDPMLAMAEAAPGVVLNAVVGPVPDGCDGADPGFGYAEAAEWSGGMVESICDPDWGDVFEDLGSLAADEPTDTFPLEAPPEPDSVEVLVDGEPMTDGWTYDTEAQAVVFDENPEGGVIIEIRYIISSTCE